MNTSEMEGDLSKKTLPTTMVILVFKLSLQLIVVICQKLTAIPLE